MCGYFCDIILMINYYMIIDYYYIESYIYEKNIYINFIATVCNEWIEE